MPCQTSVSFMIHISFLVQDILYSQILSTNWQSILRILRSVFVCLSLHGKIFLYWAPHYFKLLIGLDIHGGLSCLHLKLFSLSHIPPLRMFRSLSLGRISLPYLPLWIFTLFPININLTPFPKYLLHDH